MLQMPRSPKWSVGLSDGAGSTKLTLHPARTLRHPWEVSVEAVYHNVVVLSKRRVFGSVYISDSVEKPKGGIVEANRLQEVWHVDAKEREQR